MWCVIDREGGRIWWVQNSGSDGDDWSHNNIRTGGAGAIGRYITITPGLEERVRNSSYAAEREALKEPKTER